MEWSVKVSVLLKCRPKIVSVCRLGQNLEPELDSEPWQHTERETTSLAWTSLSYGPPAHTTASTTGSIKERTRSTKSELEERSQQRPTKEGVHLGKSRVGSSILTDTDGRDGVGVCPNVSSWTRAESRSRSRYHSALPVPFYDALQSSFYITLEAPDVEQALSVR